MNKTIKIDRDLKDIVICALRYSLRRRTYVTFETSQFIMKNPDLIDERVKTVMLRDLKEYFEDRQKYPPTDDECDYQSWLRLYNWLEGLK